MKFLKSRGSKKIYMKLQLNRKSWKIDVLKVNFLKHVLITNKLYTLLSNKMNQIDLLRWSP